MLNFLSFEFIIIRYDFFCRCKLKKRFFFDSISCNTLFFSGISCNEVLK